MRFCKSHILIHWQHCMGKARNGADKGPDLSGGGQDAYYSLYVLLYSTLLLLRLHHDRNYIDEYKYTVP